MNRNIIFAGLALIFAAGISHRSLADQRDFVWTYQYQTMHRGTAEIESYMTLTAPQLDSMTGTTSTEHQIELEVGMTDRFDFSLYQVFKQDPGSSLKYSGYKLRLRYRFGEKGRWVLDPLLYLEYKGKPDFSTHTFEPKLILARDLGRFTLALNSYFELVNTGTSKWEFEPKYAVGLSYAAGKYMHAGLEFKGGEEAQYLGPVLSHGSEGLWVALGSAFRYAGEDTAPEFQTRLLLGFSVGPNR